MPFMSARDVHRRRGAFTPRASSSGATNATAARSQSPLEERARKCAVEPVELEQSREKTIQFDAEMERTRRAPEITGKVHSALQPICESS